MKVSAVLCVWPCDTCLYHQDVIIYIDIFVSKYTHVRISIRRQYHEALIRIESKLPMWSTKFYCYSPVHRNKWVLIIEFTQIYKHPSHHTTIYDVYKRQVLDPHVIVFDIISQYTRCPFQWFMCIFDVYTHSLLIRFWHPSLGFLSVIAIFLQCLKSVYTYRLWRLCTIG